MVRWGVGRRGRVQAPDKIPPPIVWKKDHQDTSVTEVFFSTRGHTLTPCNMRRLVTSIPVSTLYQPGMHVLLKGKAASREVQ